VTFKYTGKQEDTKSTAQEVRRRPPELGSVTFGGDLDSIALVSVGLTLVGW